MQCNAAAGLISSECCCANPRPSRLKKKAARVCLLLIGRDIVVERRDAN
jgi:hypothetical protein